jgi:hypothetical protein
VVAAGALALPATALAANECVPNITIPNCPASAAGEPTIATAVTNASNGDTIVLGPQTFSESVDDTGKHLQFIGDGVDRTTIQGQGSPAMNISAGSTVTGLTINLHNEQGGIGLALAGTATNVAVTATGSFNLTNPLGVQLVSGGTFTHGSIALPLAATEVAQYAGVIGSGTVSDSSIIAPVGVGTDASSASPTVTRDRITATQGVLAGLNAVIDDSLIETMPGTASELGIGSDQVLTGFTARHDTIVGSGSAGSVGVSLMTNAGAVPAATSATLESSIVRGYVTSAFAEASDVPPFVASATITIARSFYDPATARTPPPTATGTAAINADAASGNHDPLFVNAAAGDFHLQAGSPAIDAGEAMLGSGESTTDLDGDPRVVAGHAGGGATDVGAYEFQPHAPTATARVELGTLTIGVPDTFAATGGDASPGDVVAFTWSFDDGGSASGATVTHIFTTPGNHTATVTVTDLDGFTATAQVAVTVTLPKPKLTKLKIKPRSLRNGRKATITYLDTEPGTVAFSVERSRKHHRFARVGGFTHSSVAGANRVTYRPRHLRSGRYRIVAVPRDSAGAGPAVSRRFTIKP